MSTIRLGILTPSSNTALEPLTTALVSQMPNATAHFARFKVTEISLGASSTGQFDDSKILAAADLLADAKVDVIGWSGTSSGWLGFERDHVLCERIKRHTGVPATTAVLSLNELLRLRNVRKLGLVTPYTKDVQDRIIANYREIGVAVIAERHLGISINHAFADVPPEKLRQLVDEVCASRPEAVTTFCTNLRAAPLAGSVEQAHGLPLLDTVSTTVWGMLRLASTPSAGITGWGELFQWT